MAAPKIFATGATGFIGGTALDTIIAAHPEYEITALVRNPSKAELVNKKHPKVKTIIGDLNSDEIIQNEVEQSDIVLNFANCDHVPAAKSIVAGLKKRSKSNPAYLIHTSGTGILADFKKKADFGKFASPKIFDDLEDVLELTSFPEDDHVHRDVDKVVLAANSPHIKTAIVCPPLIYGSGSGAGNVASIQVPELVRQILKRGEAFQVEAGKNVWNNVHVKDLATLYLALTEAAANKGGKATWGEEGYYFAENGEEAWGETTKNIAKKAKEKGLLKSDAIASLNNEEIEKIHQYGPLFWGTNSRGKACRAKRDLGWSPKEKSLVDTLDEVISLEAKKLGL
ncbi:hypothetical protein RUND412_002223 [Rhizina undulata]